MNLFELSEMRGNCGEFLGAVLMFVSLIFVGLQIKQNRGTG
jgi:hypothetical protein